VLQVGPGADLEAIRAAYRRLARQYHPDLNSRPEAAARMRAINAAYALLSDPARRAAFDARHYLPSSQAVTVVTAPRVQRVPVAVPANPPTGLQRRVDRIVAVLGVLLLVAIGYYAVNVIPYAEQQLQTSRRGGSQSASGTSSNGSSSGSGSADANPNAYVPERLRTDSGLRSFPGMVLVAPANLEPFASLPIMRIDEGSLGLARYAVYYGNLITGGATIAGLPGRASFDASAPNMTGCASDAAYCVGPVGGQAPGPPGLELFRVPGLVEDNPAFVSHRVCCDGVFWSVSWYVASSNMSYTIDLSRSVAAQYGSPTADDDLTAARAVAALAGQLVPLP